MSLFNEPMERARRNRWPSFPRPDNKPPTGWSHQLVTTIGRPRSHAPAPDGSRIAFFWDRDDSSDLYVQSIRGGWPERLTIDREPLPYWFDDAPQWSPDSHWIAYTQRGHVWLLDSSGGQPLNLTRYSTGAASPRWMPDGDRLLLTVDQDLYTNILSIDRGGWPSPITPLTGRDFSPEAAPDGSRVTYVHRCLDDLSGSDIMVLDLINGTRRCLTTTPGRNNVSPHWSPDGRTIAFTSDRSGFYELYLTNTDSGVEHQITQGGQDINDVAWSPDGSRILCTINQSGALCLGIIDVASARIELIHPAGGFHAQCHWLPDGQSITFEWEDPQHPPDIYTMDLRNHQVTQLTFSMPPALASLDLVCPEHLMYPSFDGLMIPSFIYRPKAPNGGAVIYPHGGPTAQYTLEWDIWAQYMVAKGYTILAPNFRGSSGYGTDFERANYGVWGVDDTKDCLLGADYLTMKWNIDPMRIGIFGGSYGGYLTICALAFDPLHRLACGVSKYGDCNLLTSWAMCDRSGHEDLYRMMGHPSTNKEAYLAGSPINKVDSIEAPILIVHGLNDPYVPPLQSEELVDALRREDKVFEYITYPDEGHGILRRKNQLDFIQRMERFIDWYLL